MLVIIHVTDIVFPLENALMCFNLGVTVLVSDKSSYLQAEGIYC